jgi:hypothetical protein
LVVVFKSSSFPSRDEYHYHLSRAKPFLPNDDLTALATLFSISAPTSAEKTHNNNDTSSITTSNLQSWQTMFSQLRDYHDLGHKRGFPTRISQWMAMQRRQYKVYATGKREAVGIIKSRVMKLNSIGFRWSLKKKRVHHQGSRDVVGSRRRGVKRVLEENDHGKDVPSKEQFALKVRVVLCN